jgi:hypothetical protein
MTSSKKTAHWFRQLPLHDNIHTIRKNHGNLIGGSINETHSVIFAITAMRRDHMFGILGRPICF